MAINTYLKYFRDIHESDLDSLKFDLSIFGCGYEKRCINILKNYKLNTKSKIVFGFKNTNGTIFNDNLSFFKNKNGEVHLIGKKSYEKIIGVLQKWNHEFVKTKDEEIRVFIDYSSMTRYWYAAIINFFRFSLINNPIKIIFGYSEPVYKKIELVDPEIQIESIDFLSHISYPEKPVALIICLGDRNIQSAGLKEYYDADIVYYFYLKNNNADKILEINKETIKNSNQIFSFKNHNLSILRHDLTKLCERLNENYRVIIAPCGPKTFTLTSIILSSFSREYDVWRIGISSKNEENQSADPNGTVIFNELLMMNSN